MIPSYGSNYASSLFTEVMRHRYENGRRYCGSTEGMDRYWAPDDAKAQETYDLMHHVFWLIRKRSLYSAPLPPTGVERILDLGTGTGIFASDIAEMFPEAAVIGTDVSPLQPPWAPPNVTYLTGKDYDFTLDFPFPEASFDFVHGRCLYGALSWQEWPELYKKAFACLKPGGYFENTEPSCIPSSDDESLYFDNAIRVVGVACADAAEWIGRPLMIMEHFRGWMAAAGFVDIRVEKRRMPLGTWPRDKDLKAAGRCMNVLMQEGFDTFTGRLMTNVLGMTMEQVGVVRDKFFQEMRDRSIHSYYPISTVYGRKPL